MVFVRCGCPSPNLGAGWIETFVPVRSISVHETVAVPKVYMLGQRAKMIASDSISFATTEELLDDVRDGSVLDIRGNFSRMIEANAVPDVLLTGSGPFSAASGFSLYPILSQRRILDADPGESSPLGRAELIKLTGMVKYVCFAVCKTKKKKKSSAQKLLFFFFHSSLARRIQQIQL
jgi:hypothetical protein